MTLKGVEEGTKELWVAFSVLFMLVMTQPEIVGNDANDLKLQSRDSDAQSDCSVMVGFALLLSFEVVLQT